MSTKLQIIRDSYGKVGPTSVMDNSIAIMRKVQVRTNTSNGIRAQKFGLNGLDVNGVRGDSSQRTYFSRTFSNFKVILDK